MNSSIIIMSLYEGAVKKPIMTSLCFLAVAIFGLFSLSKLPVDLYPDIETNTIMVMTTYQGASASDIENNVTRPLENVLNSVSNLKHITSRSSENISVITLEFEYGYDIDVLTNDVRDKLDMVSSMLPDEVCELINLDPAEIEKQRLSGRLRFAEEENGTRHYSIVDIINLKDSIDWKVINRQVESLSFEEEE